MQVTFSPDDLRPLIEAVVSEVLQRTEADQALLGDRLAIPEAEAARLLSMKPHQLRDERLDGRISATQSRGRRILYSRADLLEYLARHRWSGK